MKACLRNNHVRIAAAMLLSIAASVASAATCVFNTTGGAFNVPANWNGCGTGNGSPAGTPGPADRAEITAATVSLPAGTFTVNDLFMQNATIVGSGAGVTTLNVTAATGTWGAGSKTFDGLDVNMGSSGALQVNGLLTINNANFTTAPGSLVFLSTTAVNGTSILRNDSTLVLTGNVNIVGSALLDGAATVAIGGPITIDGPFNVSGSIDLNQQTLTLANASQFSLIGTGAIANSAMTAGGVVSAVGQTLTVNTGRLLHSITLNVGTLVNTGATIQPGLNGNPLGTFTVNGNYVQSGTGTIEFDLNGTMLGQYDRFVVAGNADFNYSSTTVPKISLNWTTPAPNVGDIYDVISFASRNGVIDTIGVTSGRVFNVAYPGTVVRVIVAPILTVNSSADSGPGSLRDALTAIQNDSGCLFQPYDVQFQVATTIQPLTALPAINCTTTVTAQFVPGFVPNTSSSDWNTVLPLTLDGSSCTSCGGLTFNAPNSVLYGVNFANWNTAAVVVNGGATNMVIHGNYFFQGVHGVYHANAQNVQIGQSGNDAARNVFVHTGAAAIYTTMQFSGSPLLIQNNLIGVGAGLVSGPNVKGIEVAGTNNVLIASNVIANNTAGLVVTFGNGINYDSNNKFYGNGIAVDLGNDGPTANDEVMPPYDTDMGSNQLLNFPTITSLMPSSGTSALVNFQIKTSPSANMHIFFCRNPGGDAQCEDNTGGLPIMTDATGFFSGSLGLLGLVPGTPITLFARADSGPKLGSMSEISPGVIFTPGPPIANITGSGAFPNTNVGSSSMPQSITIQNTGTSNLIISGLTITPPGTFIDTTDGPAPSGSHYCGFGSDAMGAPLTAGPRLVLPGQSCSIVFIFKPTSGGSVNHTLQFVTNAAGSPHSVALTGIGVAPSAIFSPSTFAFGNVPLTVTLNQVMTFTNSFGSPYTITAIGVSDARFTATGSGANPCNVAAIVAPAGSCTYTLTFTPTGSGAYNNTTTITVQPNGTGPTFPFQQASNGTGFIPPSTLAPPSAGFGNVTVGTPASQSFTFTNDSNTTSFPSTYTLTSFTTSGLGYSAVGSGAIPCAVNLMLAPGTSCGATVTFQIFTTGASGGTTTIGFLAGLGSDPPYSQVFGSSGNGVAAAATPSMTVAFAPTTVTPSTNANMTLTLTNPNASPAFISGGSITIPAGLTATPPGTNTCGTFGSVSAGVYSFGMGNVPGSGSCTIVLTVQSPTPGMYTANIAPGALNAGGANTNSSSATLTVAALLPPTISFAVVPTSITVGGTSVGTLTINNPNAVPQTANPVLFNYLPGLVNAPAPNASSTCVGANITATPGAGNYTQNTTFTLPPSGSCTFSATITSNTPGTYSGNIAAGLIVTPAGSSNATPFNITVTAAPAPAVTLTPPSVNFGTRSVNTTSPPTTVTLGNSGSALLTIASITASGDFAFTTTCPLGPSTLAVGIGCPIDITFTPLAATLRSGGIAIASNAPGSPHTITLSGTGSAAAVPGISINPATLTFAAQTVNTTSATQNVVVTNTGFANLTLSSITIAAPFGRVPLGSVTPPDCGASVAPSSSCQIGVNFGPTAAGVQAGQISITDNATGSPHTVPLTGTGAAIPVAVINTSAATVAFGDQVINSPAVTRVLTIDNTGTIPLTISAITLTGTNAANFTLTGQSGCVSIAAGASCTLTIAFATTVTGARTAQVSIASNAQNAASVNIPLTANGILAPRAVVNLSATAVGYGNVIFGGATPNQIITLTNGGAQAMTITSIVITGDFVQMNNCGNNLASLASCTISILFTPLGQGSRFGEFILTTSAASSPDRIQLSGTGCRWFSQAQSRFFLTSCG